MQEGVGKIIERRYNRDSLISFLSEELSGSELNSVMLEVHNRRAARTHPSTLLKQYQSNRFVHPAESNYFNLLEKTIHTLQIFQNHGFEPKHLSPLSVLGTCSVVGSVNQNKIISTIRNCEVLSDATNALALLVCDQKKKASEKSRTYKYSAAQRHVRAQPITFRGFSPHFTIGCLVTSGIDTGSFSFEANAIADHFAAMSEVLTEVFGSQEITLWLHARSGYADATLVIDVVGSHLRKAFPFLIVKRDDSINDNTYYKGIQFKITINLAGAAFEIADGGFVDWTQKLLNRKKERFCISGFGLELLTKFEEGLL
jgi:hypothetical protein